MCENFSVICGGAFHLVPFSLKPSEIFCPKIVDLLKKYSYFSVQNGRSGIPFPFARFSSLLFPSTEDNYRKLDNKMKAPPLSIGLQFGKKSLHYQTVNTIWFYL